MDRFMNILVRLVVFLSRFAPVLSKLGLVRYRSFEDIGKDSKLHVLLAGYNGAKNTGSDVRAAEIVRQLQERLGKDAVEISVMTMDVASMRGYFDEDVHLIPFNSIFLLALLKACCANQAVILCEGSLLKSKFANALTLYSCEAAGIMRNQHKPCIAYGSEAGEMDAFLERTVKRLCRDTVFIARNEPSLERIRRLGLEGYPGTDAAWGFDSSSDTEWAVTQLKRSGWDGTTPLLGIAPINPFWWPVKPSIVKWLKAKMTGEHARQFALWYFFSWSGSRKRQYTAYLDAIAASVNEWAARHSCRVVIFGMEQLDTDACGRLKGKLMVPSSVILSKNHNGSQMAAVLRQLSGLITSRYHALVLSMEAQVPSVAVSMDERLDNIMQEMGLSSDLLLQADDPDLSAKLTRALEVTEAHRGQIREVLGREAARDRATLEEMGDFLTNRLEGSSPTSLQPD